MIGTVYLINNFSPNYSENNNCMRAGKKKKTLLLFICSLGTRLQLSLLSNNNVSLPLMDSPDVREVHLLLAPSTTVNPL